MFISNDTASADIRTRKGHIVDELASDALETRIISQARRSSSQTSSYQTRMKLRKVV